MCKLTNSDNAVIGHLLESTLETSTADSTNPSYVITLPTLQPNTSLTIPILIESPTDMGALTSYRLTAELAGRWKRNDWKSLPISRRCESSIMACQGFTILSATSKFGSVSFTVLVHSPTPLAVKMYEVIVDEDNVTDELNIMPISSEENIWLDGGDSETFSFFYDKSLNLSGPISVNVKFIEKKTGTAFEQNLDLPVSLSSHVREKSYPLKVTCDISSSQVNVNTPCTLTYCLSSTEAGVGVNVKYRLKASEEWLVSGMTSGEVDSLKLEFTIVPVKMGVMKEVPEIVLENDAGETLGVGRYKGRIVCLPYSSSAETGAGAGAEEVKEIEDVEF